MRFLITKLRPIMETIDFSFQNSDPSFININIFAGYSILRLAD